MLIETTMLTFSAPEPDVDEPMAAVVYAYLDAAARRADHLLNVSYAPGGRPATRGTGQRG